MTGNDAITEVLKEIRKVTAQNEEIKQQNVDIKKEILNIRKEQENEARELRSIIKDLKEENEKLKLRVHRTERQLKKYNIVLHGVKEEPNENVEDRVADFLKKNLNVELNQIVVKNIYRIGQANIQKTRPILVELQNWITKNEIIKNGFKLKGTGTYISHDLTIEDLEQNRVLWGYKKKAEAFGIEAKVVKGRLMVNEKIYNFEEIKEDPLGLEAKELADKEIDERNTRLKAKRLREENTTADQSNKKNKNK